MKRKIVVHLTPSSIDAAIQQLEAIRDELPRKAALIAQKLADIGFYVAYGILAGHVYSGATIDSLEVKQVSETRYEIVAESEAIMFLEFGAGLVGYGHEKPMGYGPGTYPGQTHALNPGGWWFETDDPNLAKHTTKDGKMYGHTYGTPAYAPMYNAAKEMRSQVERIAREVFNGD